MTSAIGIVAGSSYGHAVFEIAGTPYYVQLYLDPISDPFEDQGDDVVLDSSLVVEARSNNYLYDDDERLTPGQEAALERLGWRAPGTPCDHRCSRTDEHGNWFRYATVDGLDETGAPLAGVVLATFGVYGAAENLDVNVSYDCSSGRSGKPFCS